jgi:hypothetical protein
MVHHKYLSILPKSNRARPICTPLSGPKVNSKSVPGQGLTVESPPFTALSARSIILCVNELTTMQDMKYLMLVRVAAAEALFQNAKQMSDVDVSAGNSWGRGGSSQRALAAFSALRRWWT